MEEISTRKMQQTKKRKISKWLKGFILLFLIIIAIHFNFYFAIKKEFNANQSVNPEATSYFIHANIIGTVYIGILHKIFDYDSLAMKPLLQLTDYYFEKGEKLVKTDNGEDGVWWYITYANIYDLTKSNRPDKSMNIYSLPKDEEIKLRNQLTEYIIKIGINGVKGVDFKKYESSAMHGMFYNHLSNMDIKKHYNGNVNLYWNDKKIQDDLQKSYHSYLNYLKNDQYKQGSELFILDSLRQRVQLLIHGQVIHNDKTLCDKYISSYLLYIETIDAKMKNISKQDSAINQEVFNLLKKNRITDHIMFKEIKKNCPNTINEINIIENSIKLSQGAK